MSACRGLQRDPAPTAAGEASAPGGALRTGVELRALSAGHHVMALRNELSEGDGFATLHWDEGRVPSFRDRDPATVTGPRHERGLARVEKRAGVPFGGDEHERRLLAPLRSLSDDELGATGDPCTARRWRGR